MTPDPTTRAREIVERWESEWTWLGRSPQSKQELIDAIAAALAERDAALGEAVAEELTAARQELGETRLVLESTEFKLAAARRALVELLGALDAQAALPGLSGADHRTAEARVDRALTAARVALAPQEREGER